MGFEFILSDSPSVEERLFLEAQINQFNMKKTGDFDGRELCILVKEAGETIAGIYGWTWGGGCWVDSLWVHEDHRGKTLGQRLLQAAEEEAQRRGCTQMILDTHGFQAPNFYKKYGYQVAGRVPNYPKGSELIFLRKELPGS